MKRYTSPILAAIFAFLLLNSLVSLAQSKPAFAPDKMDTVLYGAAYYTEYMPYDRLDQDVQLILGATQEQCHSFEGDSYTNGKSDTPLRRATGIRLNRI